MISVLFVYNHLLVEGGTESVMLNIFDNIDRTKFHIDFLLMHDTQTEDKTEASSYLRKKGASVYYYTPLEGGLFQSRKSLEVFFKSHHYDIVHTHMNALGAEVLKIAKKYGVPVRVAHSHNTWHQLEIRNPKDLMHYLFLEKERKQIRRVATHYIGCSEEAGEWLFGKKICKSSEYFTFKNAIDVEKYQFNLETRKKLRTKYHLENQFVVGHVGRFDYQKNHLFLIQIFERLHNQNANTKLMLIGIGEYFEKMQALVHQLNLEDSVLFLGKRSDVPELLQVMDVFYLPSHFEGLPVSLVEAQASGLKCLVSDHVSRQSDISGNVQFLGIEEDDLDQWANAVDNILKDKDERRTPIDAIRKNGYDMKFNIKKLEAFYQKALGSYWNKSE
ncbi:glycosyltransferase family 1 protein [Pseudoramibacter sp.]|jgi:glycosyltransferase involved in cell wall biosynthesis|uniref:glycosyltransferase family 1 protein n=1 Tax=Pseudoramibacter sp. TaxID=2034862 RepID=UPI0025FB47F0|nr:glycosyltransferase family 1 protein [Pseudoramibacter sp.]MCH4073126.1 glycosyltransferase family 1 protein [Pseudoramibacter sp.]MCH4106898.1 glycosyltransferase family 1 protein [Pseudoramibacter sp.]